MHAEFDIVITNMNRGDYEKLYNIAANKGISFPVFIKQSLTKITAKYKVEQKFLTEKQDTEKHKFFQIRSVSPATFETLIKICDNLKCDMSPFLKIELNKLISEYPKELTEKPAVSAYHYRLKK